MGANYINASSAYVVGATGVTVAVVDEALDWGHHEFLRGYPMFDIFWK